MKDFGKNRQQATLVNITAQPKLLRNTIGGSDRADLLRFNLSSRSNIQVTLKKLKANADLALLNSSGKLLLQSKQKGKKNEAIATTLNAGSYYLKIAPGSPQDQTKYQLQLSGIPIGNSALPPNPAPALPPNTAPTLAVNAPLSLTKGTPAVFNSNLLKAIDAEQNASQLIYTLTRSPEAGVLKLNGDRVKAGGTFTQADIDAGRLVYTSLGRTQQLTANGVSGFNPQISGFNVVWHGPGGTDGGADSEIFFFNGSTISQVTTNSSDGIGSGDINPQISGSNVVWSGNLTFRMGTGRGLEGDIFFLDGSTTTQLSTNSTSDNPQISGSNVVWSGRDPTDGSTDYEIFFFNGSTTTQLTANSTEDSNPQISGSNIVWTNSGTTLGSINNNTSDDEIFFSNGSTTTQLTSNATSDANPQISGSNVVWNGRGGTDGGTDDEIFFFNGSTISQLTTNNSGDINPQISGSNVVWVGSGGTDGGTDNEIFFFNGITTSQLTADSTTDFNPQIFGSNVVWQGTGGTDGGTDDEIFFFNGSTISQLTTNSSSDINPQVSGSNVIWSSTVGGTSAIVFNNLAKNDSFGFTIADGVGGSTSGTYNLILS